MLNADRVRFERMLFRATRGNCWIRFAVRYILYFIIYNFILYSFTSIGIIKSIITILIIILLYYYICRKSMKLILYLEILLV